MPIAITTVVVRLAGRAADDITAIEVDGAAVTLASDKTWSADVTVPVGATPTMVAVTASGPRRTETRLVAVSEGVAAPASPG